MRRLESVPRGLIFKTTLPTIALVLILSGTSSVVLGKLITDLHEGGAQKRGACVTRLVEDALQRGPNAANAAHTGLTPFLRNLCGTSEKVAFVMARDGRVAFASEPALCGSPVEPRGITGLTIDRGGTRWVRSVRPILGGPTCSGCHGAARPIGYVGTDVPLGEADAETRDQQRMNLAAGAMTALALSVLLVLVQYLLVYRPVLRLTAAVECIRGGDLSARVPAGGDDEIGQLGRSLNDMAASLEMAKHELDRTHRAELAQSEKLAALGQLFSTIAHEIKNQLAGIIGALKVVEAEAPASDANKPVLGKVLSQMERMSKTAVTALEFARPLEPVVASADAAELVDRTLFFVERQATEQGRDSSREPVSHLLALLLHEAARHGAGALHRPADRRNPAGADPRREPSRPRNLVHRAPAGGVRGAGGAAPCHLLSLAPGCSSWTTRTSSDGRSRGTCLARATPSPRRPAAPRR
ncbi:MAG: HAMP domain-containing protein [Candidatus Wallbacteria bacterium]|nr:HAMP domain-containing protein [Candidatus Wallbacteria bacterium]